MLPKLPRAIATDGILPCFLLYGLPRHWLPFPSLLKKKAHLENSLQGNFAFRKFEANELARIHKRVIFSRDTNYPRMADVKSLLKWE